MVKHRLFKIRCYECPTNKSQESEAKRLNFQLDSDPSLAKTPSVGVIQERHRILAPPLLSESTVDFKNAASSNKHQSLELQLWSHSTSIS